MNNLMTKLKARLRTGERQMTTSTNIRQKEINTTDSS